MNILKNIMLVGALSAFSLSANADFVKTDWNSSFDAQAALDQETGIEWLNLNQTKGMSINQVKGLLDTTFQGWRLPTATEVNVMMNHVTGGLTNENTDYEQLGGVGLGYNKASKDFMFYLGEVVNRYSASGDYRYRTNGLYQSNDQALRVFTVHSVTKGNSDGYGGLINDQVVGDIYVNYSTYGVFLVSDGGVTLSSINNPDLNINNINAPVNKASVPLPGTMLLLSLGLLGFSRKKTKA